uniref:BolA-like protein, putative n=1 Tax=Theileria annulata TaxID=5874 RepID=A0A3B0NGA9_THEAN
MVRALVEEKIRSALSPTILKLVDKSGGCGAAFDAVIVSSLFEGKSLLDRHRLVNSALSEEMEKIHAFSMKCHTPKEWEEKSKND